MKKFLKAILFLCALSSLAYAEEAVPVVTSGTTMSAEDQKEAMDILDRMRARIEKEEEEKAKLVAEAKELGMSPSEIASMDNVDEMLKAKREAEAKPKTEAEKLELTRKKAMNKLDFYERVVRSVAREEAEVAGYYEIMGEQKERQLGREELYAKLKEDAKIRWHRDEYKKLLKRFDEYYNKLEQKIADKEQQIVELTKLLEVLN